MVLSENVIVSFIYIILKYIINCSGNCSKNDIFILFPDVRKHLKRPKGNCGITSIWDIYVKYTYICECDVFIASYKNHKVSK